MSSCENKTLIKTDKSTLTIYKFEDTVKELFKQAVENISTTLIKKPKIHLFGKECSQQRNIGFFSDNSIGYRYSNQLSKSKPLTPPLKMILEKINNQFNANFNGILLNEYEDGTQYISSHADDEKNIDKVGVVMISYGASRKFRIRDINTKKIVLDLQTMDDEIIVMSGDFQKEFKHEIVKEKKIKEKRISATFRYHLI